ncbi:hypothetical protein SPRG_16209 [Saprolegnia parasitica CBS 223.65]|uniref:Uncharacterized protein n=1 Tax=Saprolegnia parasitica (strain CBS 223.65) TaxID=695850 RepID=A0A067BVL3_SAPPC|nr:hypothetical protein SPRG_16209 [Saprolegnia parasitica CBS 223.65]KDO18326.1 hypothetical protein SPRG_16209 [Saprolegnia parasitica CBS 223.65]|eukprot:XP_012210966.1 hypothetical protein SPRG_16209 [Saprolegnia parasitica CBS 223.65]
MTDDLFHVDVRGGHNSMGETKRGQYVVRKRKTDLELLLVRLSHLHHNTQAVAKLQLLLQPMRAIEAADTIEQPPVKRPHDAPLEKHRFGLHLDAAAFLF